VVELREGIENNPTTYLRSSITGADGSFSFTCVDATKDYSVRVAPDGALYDDEKLSEYLFPEYIERTNPFGGARNATIGGSVDIPLFLSYYQVVNHTHSYFRVRSDMTSFVGVAHTLAFWEHQFDATVRSYGQTKIAPSLADAYDQLAASFLGLGSGSTAVYRSGSALQQKLAVAALNHAAGVGMLGEFRPVQEVVLRYAASVVAGGDTETQPASDMLDKLLGAS